MEEIKKLKEELEKVNEELSKLQVKAQEISDKIAENIEKAKEIEQPGRVLEEIYYYISGDATLQQKDIDSVFDDGNYEIGNYFKTRGEAEKALEKIKIYNKLKRFAEENNTEEIDWDNSSQSKHYIYYTYGMKEILISNVTNLKSIGTIFFTSRELAEQAIKKIGDENIKKLFG